jgi:hypothetical protein
VRGPVVCTLFDWTKKLKPPIFRKQRAGSGCPISAEDALPYSQLRDGLIRLGLAAGIRDRLTSYCFRRGTANVVDCKLSKISQGLLMSTSSYLGTTTDAIQDQVMRHKPNSAVYNREGRVLDDPAETAW